MRNISFALTTAQFLARSKHVTRRVGWDGLCAGAELMAVEKGMGLKKGEHPVQLGRIRVLEVRREPLMQMLVEPYGREEAVLEGFPEKSGAEFVSMFCTHMRCHPEQSVTRIRFEYVDG